MLRVLRGARAVRTAVVIIALALSCGPPEDPRESSAEGGSAGRGVAGASGVGIGWQLDWALAAGGMDWASGSGGAPKPVMGGASQVAVGGTGSGGTSSDLGVGGRVGVGGAEGVATGAGGAPATVLTPPEHCESQLGAGPCNLVSQCGCEPGQRCGLEAGFTATRCDPAGNIGWFAPGCESGLDCAAGLGCLFHPDNTVGVCFPFCDNLSDCPNPQGECVELAVAGVGYCMPNCDPRDPQNGEVPFGPCAAGAGCVLDSEHGTSYCTAESQPGRVQGSFCERVADCAIGHTCQARTCVRYCLVGEGECDDFPRTQCAELATLTGGAVFGVCLGGTYGASGLPADIPDVSYVRSSVSVPDDFVVSRVMVKVEMRHSYCADLYLVLTGPDGDQVNLARGRGGAADDCFAETYFDDDAAVGLGGATAPFLGAFQPDEPLASLVGLGSQGTWTLTVEDTVGNDVGELLAWRLTLW